MKNIASAWSRKSADSTSMPDPLREALAEFPVAASPLSLFRFSGPRSTARLQRGQIDLTPPIHFNDPFEMWAGIEPGEGLTQEMVLRSVCSKSSIFWATMKAHQPELMKDEDAYIAKITAIVKSRPDLAASHYQTCVSAIRHTCVTGIGVACFSAFEPEMVAEPIGIRHWSMYADSHRGFVIEYDAQHSFFQRWAEAKWLFPVTYRETRLLAPLSEFDVWNDAKMWRTFRAWAAMKADVWGPEREWRIACPLLNPEPDGMVVREKNEKGQERYHIPLWRPEESPEDQAMAARAIRRVILGVNASDETKATIASVVADPILKHVEVLQARPCVSRFALLFDRVY